MIGPVGIGGDDPDFDQGWADAFYRNSCKRRDAKYLEGYRYGKGCRRRKYRIDQARFDHDQARVRQVHVSGRNYHHLGS